VAAECPVFLHLQVSRVLSRAGPRTADQYLFVDRGHLWRSFALSGLRGHRSIIALFESQVFSSLGLGPLEGHPYLVRDRAI
jgi:hypothetical protein